MSDSPQYLTLGLGPDLFGIDITHVREILDMRPVAALPNAPAFLRGMIDVRGTAFPVIDLRLKLGLPAAEPTPLTRIAILDVVVGDRRVEVGFVADRVLEVTTFDSDRLEPAPEVGARWRPDHIAGIGRRNGAFVVVFDLARLMASEGPLLVAGATPLMTEAA